MVQLRLLSAGSNAQGQLGTGNDDDAHTFTPCIFSGYPPGSLPDDAITISNIACGSNHTLALLVHEDGASLWGSGDGRKGQLGPSVNAPTTSVFRLLDLQLQKQDAALEGYVPRMIAAGWETSYVVLSCAGRSDVLISMGANEYGNLGIGGVVDKSAPRKPFYVVDLQKPLAEDGLGDGLLTIRNLATGPQHIIVQTSFATPKAPSRWCLVGWGAARHGQLGTSDETKPPLFVSTPRTVRIYAVDDITSISLGHQHSIFLHASGRLSGLGSDRKTQLRGLETLTDVRHTSCTWNGSYAVVEEESDYRIMATGSHAKGQLGRKDLSNATAPGSVYLPFSADTRQLLKLACGSEHVLGLFKHNHCDGVSSGQTEVWGWGWNEHGNLGTGTTEDVRFPMRVWPCDQTECAVSVWCGNGTSWILLKR
ncbi:uncharacterized protein FIBRA_09305 [Fibroporia radiculosa]|uniref:Uncharacterized protein n=1 Tax=Fibroporia radiculosa TaxID=599839 RepID=J7S698_9APHY|nr:uncharacterized protein FIBRA_09305 [Fibroporia radiculosa]CCM06989.1 predicted protein [Fibroporia radiculosa]